MLCNHFHIGAPVVLLIYDVDCSGFFFKDLIKKS